MVSIHDINSITFNLKSAVQKTKGATLFTLDIKVLK